MHISHLPVFTEDFDFFEGKFELLPDKELAAYKKDKKKKK